MKPSPKPSAPSSPEAGEGSGPESPPPGGMRMAELCRKSGIARETIHFYLREGLLPRPRKGGRTVAYYDDEHLDRLRTIRRLREEKYLPLAVIRRLLDSPAAAAERDVDALSEVMKIDPTLGRAEGSPVAPSAEALRVAQGLGLLGPPREGQAGALGTDPTEARILATVDDALRLDAPARKLTLEDLEACARDISGLVAKEAEIFFDNVIESADVVGTIGALRSGRGAVARFITAYRDLMLRRIVEDLLLALQHGHDVIARAATIPLSARKERELGIFARRGELQARLADPARHQQAATELVWHLFASGAAAELAALPPEVVAAAGPRATVLAVWGTYESSRSLPGLRALERAADAVPELALGQVLVGEATLVRGQRRRGDAGASLLEDAVPALHRLARADPGSDPEPVAQALGFFHKGRVELALPLVLGRRARGVGALERALAIVDDARVEIEPAARALVCTNAQLALGRHHLSIGDVPRARALLERALAVDPDGPIGEVVRGELATRSGIRRSDPPP